MPVIASVLPIYLPVPVALHDGGNSAVRFYVMNFVVVNAFVATPYYDVAKK